jgi:hypothetical protein
MGAMIKTVIIQVSFSSASVSLQASVLLRFSLAVLEHKKFQSFWTLAESHWTIEVLVIKVYIRWYRILLLHNTWFKVLGKNIRTC